MVWTKIARAHYERKACRNSTDLTDEEFAILVPYLPTAKPIGRPCMTNMREAVSAILYVFQQDTPGTWC